ncbi:methyltransferase domain-containing protein [Pseudonocardia sp. GCM10023141]|uniref:methyltransferase domain-containing protein n=1 Tax=Pseudonocardia sp. GCM10023141 TaxID=3252653 RepID=UPI0036150067
MIADALTRFRDAAITRLITGGVLTDPAWREGMRDLPRDEFVTDFYMPTHTADGSPDWLRVGPATAPPPSGGRVISGPDWLRSVHGDDSLVVALSGLDTSGRQQPVSLAPPPAAIISMLQILAPRPGHRVLELGTGVGWTTALLAHRVGEHSVTSVEIDPELHDHAAARLRAAGQQPGLVLGGSAEHADPRRYDRVLVSHHVDHVPPAWVTLVRPGGHLLLGLRGSLGAGRHALLHRNFNPATGTAELTGTFLDWTTPLPAYRRPARFRPPRRPLDPLPGPVRVASTALLVDQLTANTPLALLCQVHLPPGTTHAVRADATGGHSSYLASLDGSWAEIDYTINRGGRHGVRWAGVTNLPRLIDIAVEVHHDLGAPRWADLGLTAGAHGTRLWHRPSGTSWPLPAATHNSAP